MKKIGLFYATKAHNTTLVARLIKKELGAEVESVAIEDAWQSDFEAFENLIVGAATWFDGELPTAWDELIPLIESLPLQGKHVALFGLGDQVRYAANFADSLGLLGEAFEKAGATLIGFTSTEGYTYQASRALRQNQWCGLVIDLENQADLTDGRVHTWCKQLKKELA